MNSKIKIVGIWGRQRQDLTLDSSSNNLACRFVQAVLLFLAGMCAFDSWAYKEVRVQQTGGATYYTLVESFPVGTNIREKCEQFFADKTVQFGPPNCAANGDYGDFVGGNFCSNWGVSSVTGYNTCLSNEWYYLVWRACSLGTDLAAGLTSCVSVADIYNNPLASCPAGGNPIHPLTGSKSQAQLLLPLIGREALTMGYDTRDKIPLPPGASNPIARPSVSFGTAWESSVHKTVNVQFGSNSTGNRAIQAMRGMNVWRSYTRGASGQFEAALQPISDQIVNTGSAWRYFDAEALAIETYPLTGYTPSIGSRAYGRGGSLTYIYNSAVSATAPSVGLLTTLTDHFGRTVRFEYELPAGGKARINAVIDNAGQRIAVQYDGAGNLIQLTWPDGATRRFLYETPAFPWQLTGIVDENDRRMSTYTYDANGLARSTEYAGGVNRYSSTYISAPVRTFTENYDSAAGVIWRRHGWGLPADAVMHTPRGGAVSYGATLVGGVPRLTSQSQPSGSGCAASTSSQSYDANGNVNQRDDFNGTRSCHSYDLSRNLETSRVEGLSQATACASVMTPTTELPPNSRRLSTQWHPDWRLATKVVEPGKLITSVYNGQPDPFNGSAVASCAPTNALLPDGKPIVVLCKQVEQATTDANGALGFAAALQTGVASRVTTWTYNQWGQVLTENGPRNDVNDTTTYAYYSDTSADHTLGDLASATNAAGRVTQYTKYNRHGQVLESIDPNGVVTTNTYNLRQRLLSTTVGITPNARTTSYQYDPVGQLKRVTLPDASWIGYDYDDAHRQVAVYNHKGNRTDYQLDNAGNRVGETIKDPNGALKRQLTRSIDALGRIQQTTGRE